MNKRVRDTICQLVAELCIADYRQTKKLPSVNTMLSNFLAENYLTVNSPDVFAELVYQTSQTFQNFILEQQTKS
ncbi:hypothetical protein [Candidatus Cyanaurora vandensis]|uniref:hypothetical protein n=1 Tax=Candidatus Cyanaurora vandensis TaxID=2714958 RepID=UPI00257D7EDC|nr:hypothetical protein [Candidatus Cyanaurora vandensis]